MLCGCTEQQIVNYDALRGGRRIEKFSFEEKLQPNYVIRGKTLLHSLQEKFDIIVVVCLYTYAQLARVQPLNSLSSMVTLQKKFYIFVETEVLLI